MAEKLTLRGKVPMAQRLVGHPATLCQEARTPIVPNIPGDGRRARAASLRRDSWSETFVQPAQLNVVSAIPSKADPTP